MQGALTPPALAAVVSNDEPAPGAIPGSGYPDRPCGRPESLYRLCARTSGASPPDSGTETNLAIPFGVNPRADSRGFRVLPPPRVRCRPVNRWPVPTRVLGPFRVLHVHSVGGCFALFIRKVTKSPTTEGLSAPSTPVLYPMPCGSGRDFSGLLHCAPCVRDPQSVSEPLPSWALRPSREFPRD